MFTSAIHVQDLYRYQRIQQCFKDAAESTMQITWVFKVNSKWKLFTLFFLVTNALSEQLLPFEDQNQHILQGYGVFYHVLSSSSKQEILCLKRSILN